MRIVHPKHTITSIGTPDGEIAPDRDGAFTVPDEVGAHLVEFGWEQTGDLQEEDVSDEPEEKPAPKRSRAKSAPAEKAE